MYAHHRKAIATSCWLSVLSALNPASNLSGSGQNWTLIRLCLFLKNQRFRWKWRISYILSILNRMISKHIYSNRIFIRVPCSMNHLQSQTTMLNQARVSSAQLQYVEVGTFPSRHHLLTRDVSRVVQRPFHSSALESLQTGQLTSASLKMSSLPTVSFDVHLHVCKMTTPRPVLDENLIKHTTEGRRRVIVDKYVDFAVESFSWALWIHLNTLPDLVHRVVAFMSSRILHRTPHTALAFLQSGSRFTWFSPSKSSE